MNNDKKKSRKVVPIRRQENRYHRVRIPADPGNPRSIEIVETLLSRSDLSLCDVATEEGITTWSVIITEDLLDLALEGMAVTVPVDSDLFETDEGHVCLVTPDEWFRLGGVAEGITCTHEARARISGSGGPTALGRKFRSESSMRTATQSLLKRAEEKRTGTPQECTMSGAALLGKAPHN